MDVSKEDHDTSDTCHNGAASTDKRANVEQFTSGSPKLAGGKRLSAVNAEINHMSVDVLREKLQELSLETRYEHWQ